MKIKTKKHLNLPQLIEWAWDNDVRCRTFIANDKHIPGKVNFDENGMVDIQTTVGNDETFTVEVEEEITEDTKISKLVHYTAYGFKGTKNDTSINYVKDDVSIAFYIMNNDRTMTLIWRDGKMVE